MDALFETVPGMPFIRLYGGSLGNSMFFMLSGFLIPFRYRERIGQGNISFEDFLKRRLKKLYPMYALTNLAALLVAVWQYGISAINLRKIAFTFLLQQGGGLTGENPYNSPTWFVSALLVCYVFYFIVVRWARSPARYRCCLCAGIAWGYYLSTVQLKIPFCYPGNGSAFLNFFIGCALAELYPHIERQKYWMKPVSIVALAGSLFLMQGYGVEIISGGSAEAFSFVVCPLILYLAWADGLVSRIFSWKPFVYLGKISMPVFYWHLVLYNGMAQILGGMTQARYIGYLCLLLLLSTLTAGILEEKKSDNTKEAGIQSQCH